MIVLFTDFGLEGPYIGQMKAVLHVNAPGTVVVDLISDAPAHDPMLSAYLLAAYAVGFPDEAIFLGVVDPGVGGDRRAIVVRFAKQWFVGPDNGLVELLLRRHGTEIKVWEIVWKPENCSASFHGRDIFSPIAARLARGEGPDMGTNEGDFRAIDKDSIRKPIWPDDLGKIIYFDRFGNAMTGIRADSLMTGETLQIRDYILPVAETFTSVQSGDMFCYANANGLMEVAVNKGRAKEKQGFEVGGDVSVIKL